MKIITLTLSPAIDIHCETDRFATEHENFAKIISRDAGGKGVNVSRALLSCGIANTAIVAVGEENGDSFLSLLAADQINCEAIWTNGLIRENITVHTKGTKETRLSFDGFAGDNRLIDEVDALLNEIAESGDIVTLTGSVPSGIDIDRVKNFVAGMKAKGIKVVIDSRSFKPSDIAECAPFLIKPNEEEIVAYVGKEITDTGEAAEAAKDIFEKGIENVMISLGSRGAVLACPDGLFFANAPKIKALSTIGAGDSSIAGFLAAYEDGKSAEDCLKSAVAFGSAACMTEGTKPPRKDDIERLIGEITVKKV